MEIRTISKNIIQFEFETENELTENITVLFSGNKCSIIDTGEKGRIKKVLGYLNERGVKIENIFISHFHPDHFGGLEDCLGKIIYGSKKFKKTMDKYEWEIPPLFDPA